MILNIINMKITLKNRMRQCPNIIFSESLIGQQFIFTIKTNSYNFSFNSTGITILKQIKC